MGSVDGGSARRRAGLALLVVAALGLSACSGEAASRSSERPVSSPTPTPSQAGPHPFVGDDSWVAYQTDRTGRSEVWLVRPDGSLDHVLPTGLKVDFLLPDWSPDGKKIVFATRGGAREPLYEYDMATKQTTQLFECTGRCFGDDEPAYSPDGRKVAFIRYLAPFVNEMPSDCSLWVGDRRTGEVRQLTSNTDPQCDRESFPRWSPNGKRFVYHRELPTEDGAVTTAVYILGANGKRERRLTDPTMVAGEPDWSPDGEWIVFSTYPLQLFPDAAESQLYRIRRDGTGLEALTRKGSVRATQPRYTPDGEWIVFTAVTPTDRSLWAIPADGGEPVVIADQRSIYTHGTWQP